MEHPRTPLVESLLTLYTEGWGMYFPISRENWDALAPVEPRGYYRPLGFSPPLTVGHMVYFHASPALIAEQTDDLVQEDLLTYLKFMTYRIHLQSEVDPSDLERIVHEDWDPPVFDIVEHVRQWPK